MTKALNCFFKSIVLIATIICLSASGLFANAGNIKNEENNKFINHSSKQQNVQYKSAIGLFLNNIFGIKGIFNAPNAAPTVTSFTPTSASSGTIVTITGTGFTGATAVSFGGVAAASYTVVNATTITAVVPLKAFSGNILVTTSGGTGSKAGYIYTCVPTTASVTVGACGSYTWHGTTYTASTNTATFDTINAAGCDSLTTLNLTIKTSANSLSISGVNNICLIGGSAQLSSNFVGGTWGISSSSAITISNTGLVSTTGGANTTATVKYYCAADSTSLAFTYLPYITTPYPITGPTSVCSGSTIQMQTNVLSDAQNILNGTTGAWSVANPLRGTISTSGVLTGGTQGGNPIVQYTLTNRLGCSVTLSNIVTLTNIPAPTVTGATSVCTQTSVQLSATPAGASSTWGVQNAIRGSITNTGVLTGAAPNANAIVTYRYTDANGCSSATAYYNVFVNASVATPRITTLSGTYCIGKSYNFTASPVGGTWSTNNAIAGITSSTTSAATAKINSVGSFGIVYNTAADVNGCKATTTFIRTSSNCTAPTVILDTLQNSNESARIQTGSVSIYPNPARGVVTVNSPSVDANSSLSIADITGKIVKTQAITDKQTKVNVSNLTSGIYFISIQSAEGKTTKKLIINN